MYDWIAQIKQDGLTEEHIAKLRGTNKSIFVERRYEYGVFGVRGTEDVNNDAFFIKGRKPHLNTSILTNFFINGKNHWQYKSSSGCIGNLVHFTGETLDEFVEAERTVIDTIYHPDYADYLKKFDQYKPLETLPITLQPDYLEVQKYTYTGGTPKFSQLTLPFSMVGIQDNHGSFTILTFDHNGAVDQHIQIDAEQFRKIWMWTVEKQLKDAPKL